MAESGLRIIQLLSSSIYCSAVYLYTTAILLSAVILLTLQVEQDLVLDGWCPQKYIDAIESSVSESVDETLSSESVLNQHPSVLLGGDCVAEDGKFKLGLCCLWLVITQHYFAKAESLAILS